MKLAIAAKSAITSIGYLQGSNDYYKRSQVLREL